MVATSAEPRVDDGQGPGGREKSWGMMVFRKKAGAGQI